LFVARLRRAEFVDHHRVIDDEVDGDERVDLLRVAAELAHRVAHRGEIDDARHAGEILHQHARRAILDLALGRAIGQPLDHRLKVVDGDGGAVLEAEEVLQQHLHREGQARNVAQRLGGLGETVIGDLSAIHVEDGTGGERVVADGGHWRLPLLQCGVWARPSKGGGVGEGLEG
jgi:hypothetical protein